MINSATADESPFSNDEIYDILSDTRRRFALHYLKQRNEPVSVRDLAEQVAAWENEKPISDLTSQERKRVYISLYQSHLPTLDKQGIVSYDESDNVVELSEPLTDTDIYLEVVPEQSIPWSYYYVGISLAGFVLVALAYADFAYFGDVPGLAYAVLFLAIIAVSAGIQTYQRRRTRLGDTGSPPSIENR